MWHIGISHKRTKEFFCSNPIRSPIRVNVTRPISAVHTSTWGAWLLVLDFSWCWLRLWYMLAYGPHPRWAPYSFFLPLQWKIRRERKRTSKNDFKKSFRLILVRSALVSLESRTALCSVVLLISLFVSAAPEQREALVNSLTAQQKSMCRRAAGSTLSSNRLRHRLAVVHRYLVALGRRSSVDEVKPEVRSRVRTTSVGQPQSGTSYVQTNRLHS